MNVLTLERSYCGPLADYILFSTFFCLIKKKQKIIAIRQPPFFPHMPALKTE
jgi:hypothetical protein